MLENIFFILLILPSPKATVINLEDEVLNVLFKKLKKTTTPPTTLYIPKFTIPKAFKTMRLVYKEITNKSNILKYNIIVFLAILLLLIELLFIIM